MCAMSTPTEPDEPTEQPPAIEPEPAPQAQPAGPAPQAAYQPYPFLPRYKEPWVNPAKRTTVAVVGAVLGLLLLGGGFVVGAAVAHHHDRQQVTGYWTFDHGVPNGRMPQFVQPRPGYRQPYRLPMPRVGGPAAPPATPTPAPTKSHR